MQLPLSLDYIRQVLAEYFADKPVRRIQVFGSYARGEATAESDLDLLVEMAHPVGWEYFGYAEDLSQRLGIAVDLGSGVSDYMFRYIAKDLKTIYEPEQATAA
ncbi:nucleotidyltransferase family protein [uncultured Hymenobacter sp.]|uniref:nucleotidyltransferase family protein n=1 Tax=uncultured Hymenobacter sp. TaxID=170016 RepID=UPI0035CC30F2